MIPMGPKQWLRLLLCAFQTKRRLVRCPSGISLSFPGGRRGLPSEAAVIETTLIVYTTELRRNQNFRP
jgi:hypothetical protein